MCDFSVYYRWVFNGEQERFKKTCLLSVRSSNGAMGIF